MKMNTLKRRLAMLLIAVCLLGCSQADALPATVTPRVTQTAPSATTVLATPHVTHTAPSTAAAVSTPTHIPTESSVEQASALELTVSIDFLPFALPATPSTSPTLNHNANNTPPWSDTLTTRGARTITFDDLHQLALIAKPRSNSISHIDYNATTQRLAITTIDGVYIGSYGDLNEFQALPFKDIDDAYRTTWHSNGEWLLTTSSDKAIIWSAETFETVQQLPDSYSTKWLPNSNLVLQSTYARSTIVDVFTNEIVWAFEDNTNLVRSVGLSPNSEYLVLKTSTSIELIAFATGQHLHSISGEDVQSYQMPEWSPNSRYMLLITNEDQFALFDVENGFSKQIIGNSKGYDFPHELHWAPDSQAITFLTMGDHPNKQLYKYELISGQDQHVDVGTTMNSGRGGLVWLPNNHFITGTSGESIVSWDMETLRKNPTIGSTAPLRSTLQWSADWQREAYLTAGGTLVSRDVVDHANPVQFADILHYKISPSGKLAIAVTQSAEVVVLDLQQGIVLTSLAQHDESFLHWFSDFNAAWSADEARLAFAKHNSVEVWRVNGDTFQNISQANFAQPVTAVAWANTSDTLAFGTDIGHVYLSDPPYTMRSTTTVQRVFSTPTVQHDITKLAWSPDDATLAVGVVDLNQPVHLVDMASFALIERTVTGDIQWRPSNSTQAPVQHVSNKHLDTEILPYTSTLSWSPDGQLLLYYNQVSVRIMDVATQRVFDWPDRYISGEHASWSLDGTSLVFLDGSPMVQIYGLR